MACTATWDVRPPSWTRAAICSGGTLNSMDAPAIGCTTCICGCHGLLGAASALLCASPVAICALWPVAFLLPGRSLLHGVLAATASVAASPGGGGAVMSNDASGIRATLRAQRAIPASGAHTASIKARRGEYRRGRSRGAAASGGAALVAARLAPLLLGSILLHRDAAGRLMPKAGTSGRRAGARSDWQSKLRSRAPNNQVTLAHANFAPRHRNSPRPPSYIHQNIRRNNLAAKLSIA